MDMTSQTQLLLIEDDQMILEIYQKRLEQAGYKVDVAINGTDGLQKIRTKKYDLVLLDLVLPGLDGIGVLKDLSDAGKEKLPSPIVVFSNLSDNDNQEEAYRFGASGFIAKSQYNPTELVNEVERYLRETKERTKNEVSRITDQQGMPQEQKEGAPRKRHLLFIEDEEVFINLFVDRLKKGGYRVSVARTGAEAFVVMEEEKVDLVITDMILPVMRGDELVARLRYDEKTKSIPIIVITASATDEQVQSVKSMGIQGFYLKTRITPSELATRIKEIFGQE